MYSFIVRFFTKIAILGIISQYLRIEPPNASINRWAKRVDCLSCWVAFFLQNRKKEDIFLQIVCSDGPGSFSTEERLDTVGLLAMR